MERPLMQRRSAASAVREIILGCFIISSLRCIRFESILDFRTSENLGSVGAQASGDAFLLAEGSRQGHFFLRFRLNCTRCISIAPAMLDRYLAALPAMSLIPFAPFFTADFLAPLNKVRR